MAGTAATVGPWSCLLRARGLAGPPQSVQPPPMTIADQSGRPDARTRNAAKISIRFGKRATLDASVTTAGMLSAGALVSAILLSTAVVVAAAGRTGARRALAAPDRDAGD